MKMLTQTAMRNLRVIAVFSLLLLASFATVGLAFNFAVHSYVNTRSYEILAEARAEYMNLPHSPSRGLFMRTLDGGHSFFISEVSLIGWNEPPESQVGQTILDVRGEFLFQDDPPQALRLRVYDEVFFMLSSPEGIFYLEATHYMHFVTIINRLLLLLGTLIWLASIIIAGFLADSMVRPLRLLQEAVKKIGSGDFSANDLHFRNEEFEELNQTLQQTAKQLAGYDNDQKTFFQNVSHELRTPLMSIKSYAEGIKYGVMPAETASETILEATDRLTDMVDDILYVSRIDNLTPPVMENTNLCTIAEERVKHQSQIAKSKGIVINYECKGDPIIIQCSKTYIERVVDNLISNALRYAKNTIKVECFADGNRAVLRVTDDGEGFEKKVLPYVFERFYRGKNGLAGIGLSIVKSIMDQHKGTATAENGKKNGAILTISLPRTRE